MNSQASGPDGIKSFEDELAASDSYLCRTDVKYSGNRAGGANSKRTRVVTVAGSGAVICAEEPGNAQANLCTHPARQISSQAGDCIEMAPWQTEEARTWPWLSGEAGCFCGQRAGSSVLPAKRQQLLCALPENRFCSQGVAEAQVKMADFTAVLAEAAAAAKPLQSCPTLCDPADGSPPGSAVPGIL